MIVLGIESTAHTFGVAILRDREILANERSLYTTQSGGMIPFKVAQHHEEEYANLLRAALEKAGIGLRDVNLVAYSNAPGIGQMLRVGAAAAKSLALLLGVPLVGVNHCIAHLEVAGLSTAATDPVLLYCSGANTQVIAYDEGQYRIFGETLDTGVGNFLDTIARELGLGFPGGPKIEELARAASDGGRTPELIALPYVVKGMDVGFAGLETHVIQKIRSQQYDPRDLAFSIQEVVFAMLVEVAERAMAHVGKQELVLGGGVACNARLQEMCRLMCEDRGARFYCPPKALLVDNAAMIAWTGMVMHERGGAADSVEHAGIKPYERTDDVTVTWRSS
jgi:N6-L-threonylcarbamoyladenine synthase